jgi:hypothetical protein
MLKKILIAVGVGALLSPVGLALSSTGGKGLVKGGSSYCSKKAAHAAGGSHPVCTSTSRSTITKYKTVSRPSTTTRVTHRTTTVINNRTYTVTTTEVYTVQKTITEDSTTTVGGDTKTLTGTVTTFTGETPTDDCTTTTTTSYTTTTNVVTETTVVDRGVPTPTITSTKTIPKVCVAD